MKKTIILFYLILHTALAFSQLDRGQWLAGGSALGMLRNVSSGTTSSSTTIQAAPDAGYFLADKFAVGLRAYYTRDRFSEVYNTGYYYGGSYTIETISTSVKAGPFIRYYFLPNLSNVNFFADAAYAYGYSEVFSESNGHTALSTLNSNTVNISAGPVFILNPHTSLMIILNYQYVAYNSNVKENNLIAGVGFQIHLGNGRMMKKAVSN